MAVLYFLLTAFVERAKTPKVMQIVVKQAVLQFYDELHDTIYLDVIAAGGRNLLYANFNRRETDNTDVIRKLPSGKSKPSAIGLELIWYWV